MTKYTKSILSIILFSFFGILTTNSFGAKIIGCSNCGEFGDNLGKVVPKDHLFYLTRTIMRCNSPKKKWKKTMQTFISSEYMWGYKKSTNGITLLIGHRTKSNGYKIDLVEKWFPKNSTMYYHFIEKEMNNPIEILDKSFEGHKYKNGSKWYPCTISWSWEGKPEKYRLNDKKNSKYHYNRAIQTLKTFETRQYDINQFLSKNVQSIGVKFQLTDLITDLTIKKTKLDNTPKIIVKEDKESKKLAEQRTLELEEERARLKTMEIERKKLKEKTKKLTEQNRLAELNAKKRSEEIAKEVAAQEREKLEEERALRRAEEKARKIAQEKAKQLAAERQKAEKVAKQLELERVIAEKKNEDRLKKLDEERKKSEKIAKQLRQERIIAEEKNKERLKKLNEERKKSNKIAEQLRKERKIAEQKARDLEKSQQTQLASIQKEKAKREKLIQEEKKKREELEKKLVALQEENRKNRGSNNSLLKIKLPPEWMPFQNKMSLQQEQFCQLTNRFFKDMKKAIESRNDIRVNMVHQDRQENMDGLIPSGKINNWIFKVIKIEQVEDGSAAVVLRLQCKSFVGSGQIYSKSTWRKKSNKEWRATIPREDRRFRELAKLGVNDFILGSGTLLEIEAFKPGQIETFYASQQIGEHPLTKGLNLEGELFIADLSYIAALN